MQFCRARCWGDGPDQGVNRAALNSSRTLVGPVKRMSGSSSETRCQSRSMRTDAGASTTTPLASVGGDSTQRWSTSPARSSTPYQRERGSTTEGDLWEQILDNLSHSQHGEVTVELARRAGSQFRIPAMYGSLERLTPNPEPHPLGWTAKRPAGTIATGSRHRGHELVGCVGIAACDVHRVALAPRTVRRPARRYERSLRPNEGRRRDGRRDRQLSIPGNAQRRPTATR